MAKHTFCSVRSLVIPGLQIVPVKIYTDTQNLLHAMPSVCEVTRNISHSDQILPLLKFTSCGGKYNMVTKLNNYFT